jgi:uncharacterized repeat protein (TIGR01451 family)
VINTFANTLAIYGMAWDMYSDGGPYLWVWSQDGTPAVLATQIDPATGTATGVSFVGYDGGWTDNIAGGATIVNGDHPDYPGMLLFVGLHQADSDMIIGYDLDAVVSPDVPWLFETPITGTIDADSNFLVDVTFETVISPTWTLDLGTYTATLKVKSDDPMTGTHNVPVTLHVVEPAYGVAISGDQSLTGLPGETVTYTVVITNASNGPTDSFTVTLGASAWTSTLSDDVVGPLGVGESAAVEVVVEIPADALVGDADVVSVTATSQGDPGESASADLTTEVAGDFGVDLAPEASAAEGAPGDMITYTLRLTNTGTSMADTFAITVTGVLTDWVVHLPVTSVTLDPGEGVDVIVHVTIPAGAASGEADEITVIAASAYDVAATDSVTITTTVEAVVVPPLIFLPIITKLFVLPLP